MMNSTDCSAVYHQGLALAITKTHDHEHTNTKNSTETYDENVQSSTEMGVWIKQAKQDFELYEKQ